LLAGLRPHADDPAFRAEWAAVKRAAKERLAAVIAEQCGVRVSPDALFDIQVKRIHEYKRQLLNVLSIIHRYDQLKTMSPEQRKNAVPRVCVIGGKATPGYDMAKRIIKLVSAVGDKINRDPEIGDLLKLVFIPDYNVSLAEVIIPASELSQHISTAGTEASGTSNMKFALNGGLIIGTMDGANVEIAEEIGAENMFIFGALAADVPRLRRERASYRPDARFVRVCEMIRGGTFGWSDFFAPIVDSITGGDFYLLGVDFADYLKAQDSVDATYRDSDRWTRMSILSTAGAGKFSSDRTIREYAKDIWRVQPARRPTPGMPVVAGSTGVVSTGAA
jgi:starch phosphorylase